VTSRWERDRRRMARTFRRVQDSFWPVDDAVNMKARLVRGSTSSLVQIFRLRRSLILPFLVSVLRSFYANLGPTCSTPNVGLRCSIAIGNPTLTNCRST